MTVKDETVAQLRAELEDEVIQGSYSEMEPFARWRHQNPFVLPFIFKFCNPSEV